MKTLYLDASATQRVLRDGPALCVRASGQARRLFPLQRLCRVVVSGNVRWDTDALLACAEAGIPVLFIGGHGQLRGRFLAGECGGSVLQLGATLDIYLDVPHSKISYRTWVANRARAARLAVNCGPARERLAERSTSLRRLLNEAARRFTSAESLRRLDRRLYALTHLRVEEMLKQIGIDPDAPALAIGGINLVRDFTDILLWPLQTPKLRLLKRLSRRASKQARPHASRDFALAARFHEACVADIERQLRQLISRFHLHMLEVVDGDGG